jgi:tetratricopeptide (TPR) repeat protein
MAKEKTQLILLSAVFLFVFLMGITKIGDYDIFYHLCTGKHIVETGSIKHPEDPFTFTSIGSMPTNEWLAEVIFYGIQELSGIGGLIFFKAALITLLFYILLLNMRLISTGGRWNNYIFFLVLITAAYAIRMRMFVRPFVFEYLLLALCFYVLNLYKFKKRNYLFMLPIFQVLWVNVHPSNILGMAVPSIYLVAGGLKYLLEGRSSQDKKWLFQLCLAVLAVGAASLINPNGYKVFTFPFMVTGQEFYDIAEFQQLSFSSLIGYGFRYTWGFSLLLVSAAIIFLYKWRKPDLTELLIFFFFLLMLVKGIRFTAEFSIAVAPIVARGYSGMVSRPGARYAKVHEGLLCGFILAALVVVFYASIYNSKIYAFGLGLKDRVFPENAVDFLKENGIRGNMYNSQVYGGYLSWRFFPDKKVFIDGRWEIYEQAFISDSLEARNNPDVWERVVKKHDIDWVILEYSRDYSGKERINHLVGDPRWALVYWDRVAVVYARRGSRNEEFIKMFEYKYTRPNDYNPAYLRSVFNVRGGVERALGELDRNVSISPDNEEAHLALAYMYYMLGMRKKEMEELENALKINPQLSFVHSALGEILLERGDLKGAEDRFKDALKIEPDNKVAISGLKRLGNLKE